MMDDRISMAVVGLVFGRHMAEERILAGKGAEFIRLCGVCDTNAELSAAVAAALGVKQFHDLDEILNDPATEAVGLFTGPNGRAELISKIIQSGKHVMTTKPFETDAEAAEAVLVEARELGKAVHLNSPGPLPGPETAQLLEWMKTYDLGRPVSVHWETYASYAETADGSWYDDPAQCPVAPMFRLGIYGLNQVLRLCGDIEHVNVIHSRIRTRRPTPDNALLSLQFESGVVGSLHASFCVDNGIYYPDDLTLHFERGSLRTRSVVNPDDGQVIKELSLQSLDDNGAIAIEYAPSLPEGIEREYQWHNFSKAVREGAPLDGEITPQQVATSIRVVNAMAAAERKGAGSE